MSLDLDKDVVKTFKNGELIWEKGWSQMMRPGQDPHDLHDLYERGLRLNGTEDAEVEIID